MANLKWKKNIINDLPDFKRYEYVSGKYTIDVDIGKEQGYPGSNMVNIYDFKRGYWLLNTPKMFKTKKQVCAFVSKSKNNLDKGIIGRKVSIPI